MEVSTTEEDGKPRLCYYAAMLIETLNRPSLYIWEARHYLEVQLAVVHRQLASFVPGFDQPLEPTDIEDSLSMLVTICKQEIEKHVDTRMQSRMMDLVDQWKRNTFRIEGIPAPVTA